MTSTHDPLDDFQRFMTESLPPVGNERNLEGLRRQGLWIISTTRNVASRPGCPDRLTQTWQVIADWLRFEGGEFTNDQIEQITGGWLWYLSNKLAPSLALQPHFEAAAETIAAAKNVQLLRPPTAVIRAFDRMMATEEEIEKKRALDFDAERRKLEPLFKEIVEITLGPKSNRQTSFNQYRRWAFFLTIWILVVYLYTYIFDPFDTGGWDDMGDEEFNRVAIVAISPLIGVILYRVYKKWIV